MSAVALVLILVVLALSGESAAQARPVGEAWRASLALIAGTFGLGAAIAALGIALR